MEDLVKELHDACPSMPDSLALPKYYFKTVDEAKLHTRRVELQDFWEKLTDWSLAEDNMNLLLTGLRVWNARRATA